jgi:hypothetical protein
MTDSDHYDDKITWPIPHPALYSDP